ncbi:hypothetical protein SB659_08995 [Arthrobacter sp. SIMBA_036]|uniref:hypothetical protein n=1 Tax=Arthrobacter sp. SIMBA_036 TaxID=3085778 RepID=UPI00397B068C
MTPSIPKADIPLAHGVTPSAATVARRRAAGHQKPAHKPDALLGAIAVRELFHRWPLVPSRELERIRHVLIHCDQLGSPDTHHLSEPAQALLQLINDELDRRRQPDVSCPPDQAEPADSAQRADSAQSAA